MAELSSIGISRYQQSADIVIREDLIGDLLGSTFCVRREAFSRKRGDQRSERLAVTELLGQFVEHLDGIRGAAGSGELAEVSVERGGPERGGELLDESAHGGEVAAAREVPDDGRERAVGGVERAAADEEAEEVGGCARGVGRGERERLGEERVGGAHVGEMEREVGVRGGGGRRGRGERGERRREGRCEGVGQSGCGGGGEVAQEGRMGRGGRGAGGRRREKAEEVAAPHFGAAEIGGGFGRFAYAAYSVDV